MFVDNLLVAKPASTDAVPLLGSTIEADADGHLLVNTKRIVTPDGQLEDTISINGTGGLTKLHTVTAWTNDEELLFVINNIIIKLNTLIAGP